MAKKVKLKLSTADIQEVKRQNRLIHTAKISLRDRKNITEDRNPYQRDYARILYSSAFRRLQGKMQVLGIENTAFFRNRLTHSLEVSQIAKGIRVKLDEACGEKYTDLGDIFLLEAAALAHDIGHPAFGHKGERVLDEIARQLGMHFEGNAQNFRVLRTIEKKEPDLAGLNLSYRTLLAINKYIVPEAYGVKKFMYREDYDHLQEFREKNNLQSARTLDVQIIELADDIAYAVHDLEDALSQAYFSIDELYYEMTSENIKGYTDAEVEAAAKEFERIVNKSKKSALASHTYGNLQEYSQVFRRTLTSELTKLFVNDITLGTVDELEAIEHGTVAGCRELKLGQHRLLCKILSKKIFKCICRQPHVAMYELRGEKIIKALYDIYADPAVNQGALLLPPDYRAVEAPGDTPLMRRKKWAYAAINYIAGMMDSFAIEQYNRYFTTPFDQIKLL